MNPIISTRTVLYKLQSIHIEICLSFILRVDCKQSYVIWLVGMYGDWGESDETRSLATENVKSNLFWFLTDSGGPNWLRDRPASPVFLHIAHKKQ